MIEDGSVLIKDGRIFSVGSTRRLENLKEAKGALVIPVNGSVVMPGFVDPAVNVTIYDHRQQTASIPKRKKALDFSEEALTLVRSCLQHGTLNGQLRVYSDGGVHSSDVVALRHLAALGSNPLAMLRSLRLPLHLTEGALRDLAKSLASVRRKRLADFIEMVCSAETPLSEAFWSALRDHALPVNLTWSGGPPETLARLLELARPRSVFCPVELSPDECAALAHSPAMSIFSPGRDMLEERDNPSVRKLAASGGAIALASGYDSKDAPIFSMQMVVALAVLRLRLTVEQAIVASTVNAAHALGCAHEVGTIEVGKRADLLVLNLSDYREIPRRLGVNHVAVAIKDGELAMNRKRAKASAG